MAALDVQKMEPPQVQEEMTEEKLATLPPELLVKHPLQNPWTLWYYENDKSRTWEQNQVEIITVNSVEDFWSTYNYIETASNLKHGTDYSLFKQGVKPMWEDSKNRNGGRWLISLDRSDKQRRERLLDVYWLDVMLLMIGEGFGDAGETVCGAVVNIRNKGDKIAIWTGDAKRAEEITKIGQRLKEVLNINPKITIGYQAHSDTMVKSGSIAKNRYVV
ncbi:eukaryotic translation initiation factor 4E-like isoform X2 [Amphibalanus amphitrite]|uniref:eukaryotic translation initiation factor 4E-like isoform X2 n=1 Tax=Amphibalanus amphitrite TaxID=1232801 RepID=UPI001C905621|nr:eukaryotic translation initiation factor 4E-like isoform X2 [Amphibalanus amphitrite]